MTTFPAFAPIYAAPKQTQTNNANLSLGDGFAFTHSFGLNTVRPEWQLAWEIPAAEAAQIDAFLQQEADAGTAFNWQPPDSQTPLLWRCDEWSIEQITAVKHRITATFRRVFELSFGIPTLIPADAFCDDDTLCETDLGSTGSDFWVSRLASPFYTYASPIFGSTSSADPQTNVVVDSRGNSYQPFLLVTSFNPSNAAWTGSLHIVKRNVAGAAVWTKELVGNDFSYARDPFDTGGEGVRITVCESLSAIILAVQTTGSSSTPGVCVYAITFDGVLFAAKQYSLTGPFGSVTQAYLANLQHLRYSDKIIVTFKEGVGQGFCVINPTSWEMEERFYSRISGQFFSSVWSTQAAWIIEFSDLTKIFVSSHDQDDDYSCLIKLDANFTPINNVCQIPRQYSSYFTLRGDSIVQRTATGYWVMSARSSISSPLSRFDLDNDLNVIAHTKYSPNIGMSYTFTGSYFYNQNWYILVKNMNVPGTSAAGSGVLEYNPATDTFTNASSFSYGLPNNSNYGARRALWGASPRHNRAVFAWGRENAANDLTVSNVFCAGIRMYGEGDVTTLSTGPYTATARARYDLTATGVPVTPLTQTTTTFTWYSFGPNTPATRSDSLVDRSSVVQWDLYTTDLN